MAVIHLPAGWPQVLAAIVDGPGAWASAAAIAERLGIREQTAVGRCKGLERKGWLSSFLWDYELPGSRLVFEELVYTLTDKAVAKLAVELEGDGDGEERWARRGRSVGLQGRPGLADDEVLSIDEVIAAYAVDPAQRAPDELAEEKEELERYLWELMRTGAKIDFDDLPWPTIVMTGGPSTWREWGHSPHGCQEKGKGRRAVWRPSPFPVTAKPGTFPPIPESCECCDLAPLGSFVLCLRCFRWGWKDHVVDVPARVSGDEAA